MSPASSRLPQPADAPPLLGPADPPVFTWVNEQGRAPLLLLCDHASNAVPASLDRLGLPAPAMGQHIAYDVGAGPITRMLSARFDAPALLSGFSRLVIDLNRALDDPTSVPEISDGVVVPGNRNLDEAAVARRVDALFTPYHDAVGAALDRFAAAGRVPAVVSIHSFTPVMHGLERPWHIGVLWDRDPRVAVKLIEGLRADGRFVVGDNEPYSGRRAQGTIDRHAASRGIPHALIEFRQDLIAEPDGQAEWATRLGDALAPILADAGLYRVERF